MPGVYRILFRVGQQVVELRHHARVTGASVVETVIEESERQLTTMELTESPMLEKAVVTIRTRERSADTTEVTFPSTTASNGPIGRLIDAVMMKRIFRKALGAVARPNHDGALARAHLVDGVQHLARAIMNVIARSVSRNIGEPYPSARVRINHGVRRPGKKTAAPTRANRQLTAAGLLGSASSVSPEAQDNDPRGPTPTQLLLGLALIAGIGVILVTQC